MKRKLRLVDRILLILATIGDIVEEIRDPGGLVAAHYKTLYGWVPARYQRNYFKKTVEKMLKVKSIEKIVKNGKPFWRITSGGREELKRDFPILAFRKKKWDGVCTFVSFDIEEKLKGKRDKFRLWLYQIGAGKMHKSGYLLPYNLAFEVKEAVRNFGLKNQVEVFPTTLDFVDDKKTFARKVWKLGRVEKKYREVLSLLKLSAVLEGKAKEDVLRKARAKYIEALLVDPLLPKELLPEDWIGERVRKMLAR